MPACIDLRKAHLHRQHGDLLAVYTWINAERALVLIPAYRPKAPWYVAMESAAYLYDDPAYLAKACVKACEVLGIEPIATPEVAEQLHQGAWRVAAEPYEPTPSVAHISCTRRQGRLALLMLGLLEAAEAAIAAMPDGADRRAAQIEYEADTWERHSPFLSALWAQLGGTPESLDTAFGLAVTL